MGICELHEDCRFGVSVILMHENTWNTCAELSKTLEDFKKSGEQYRKSTTLVKRSKKLSARHKHDRRFKSFWSKQKSNRYA